MSTDISYSRKLTTATGATVPRSDADRFADYALTPDDFDAVGDGVANDAAAMTALFANARRIYVPAGTYLIDDIAITEPRDVVCDAGAVFKKRAGGVASSRLFEFLPGSEGSTWFGGVMDGNTALHAAYAINGIYDGWFGMVSRAEDITVQSVTFRDWVQHPFWIAGDYNIFKNNRMEDCGGAGLFGWRCFGAGRFTSRPAVEGAFSQDVDGLEMLRCDNNGKAGVYQHALDLHGPKGGSYRNLLVIGQAGATASPSAWISGITCELCEDCVFEDWIYEDPTSDVCIHLAFSFVGCVGCNPRGLRTRGVAGAHFEWNGGEFTLSDFVFDGGYRTTTAVPAGDSSSIGLTIYAGVYGPERVAKSLAGTHFASFVDGLITGVTYGGILRCQSGSFSRAQVFGALTVNLFIVSELLDDDFPGALAVTGGDWVIDNCDLSYAGGLGLSVTTSGNVYVSNSRIKNNGQDITIVAVDSRVGASVAAGDLFKATNCDMSDDQTFTFVDRISYAPQVSDADNKVYVLMSPPEKIERGQWVKIIGALAGPLDLTAKVVDYDTLDGVTLQCTAPVTLVDTGNITALTGTWTGAGTTLNADAASGNAIVEVPNQMWVTDGTEWRRIIKVVTKDQIIINSAFTTPMTADVLTKLTTDITGIPSQTKALRLFGLVNAILLRDNVYSGNTVMPMQLSDPSKCIFGCEYYRDATVSPTINPTNLLATIHAGHKMIGCSMNVDVALSGGGITSWSAVLTNSGGTTLETIGTALALVKNTKVNTSMAGPAMVAAGNQVRFTGAGGAPTAGTITIRGAFRVELPLPAVPSAP